jgi:hypothetical protein
MKRILLAATLLASVAGAALADGQLARSLDVEPGTLSNAELVQLKNAIEANDNARVRLILERTDLSADRAPGISAGRAKMAEELHVDPSRYSTVELMQLHAAIEAGDNARADWIRSGGAEAAAGRAPGSGHAQLARELGVDPSDHTTAELAAMYLDRNS